MYDVHRKIEEFHVSVYKRPFGSPNAVIYSYQLSKLFLDQKITSILEVGCGIGIFAMRYAPSHPNVTVVAVDHSTKTIDFLVSQYGRYYKNLQLRLCDFCQPNLFLGNTFDAVYSSDVLEHVIDVTTFVENIYQHLRPSGKAVINFPNESNHGINHFAQIEDVRKVFAAFSDVKVSAVDIHHPVHSLWLGARTFYERLFSRSTLEERRRLYSDREEQGIDCFEESTCFQFANSKGKLFHLVTSLFAEVFLLFKPSIQVRPVEDGAILDVPRLVVVATK